MWRRVAVLPTVLLPIVVLDKLVAAATKDNGPLYYYRIESCDGSSKFVEQTADDARKLEKELSDEYKDLTKAWGETKKKWAEVFGTAPFPLPKPNPPNVIRLARVPTGGDAGAERMQKYQHTLNFWNVCLVKNYRGKRSVEVVRRDRMGAKLSELMKEYVQAAMEWKLAHKDGTEETKEGEADKPFKPSITVVKESLREVTEAEQLAEKLAEKLDAIEEKKAAEEEKKKQAEEANKQAGAAGGGAANPGGN